MLPKEFSRRERVSSFSLAVSHYRTAHRHTVRNEEKLRSQTKDGSLLSSALASASAVKRALASARAMSLLRHKS